MINQFATILVTSKGWATEREIVEQALELAPETFAPYAPVIYGTMPSIDRISQLAESIYGYLREHAAEIFGLLIEYMIDEGRELPLSTIHDRFSKVLQTKESAPLYGACEMLCDMGILEESIYDVRLTKKSTVAFTEPAYVFIGDRRDYA